MTPCAFPAIATFWIRGLATSVPFSPSARRCSTPSWLTKVTSPTGTVISATANARPLIVTVVPVPADGLPELHAEKARTSTTTDARQARGAVEGWRRVGEGSRIVAAPIAWLIAILIRSRFHSARSPIAAFRVPARVDAITHEPHTQPPSNIAVRFEHAADHHLRRAPVGRDAPRRSHHRPRSPLRQQRGAGRRL